jgi:hypothetical protein
MSASTRSVPAPIGWGRFPTTLAAVALVVILAVAVALAALNGAKAAPAVETGTKGAPPPAFHDSDARGQMYTAPVTVPFHDSDDRGKLYIGTYNGTSGFGGWSGPRAGSTVESSGGHNGTRIAQ